MPESIIETYLLLYIQGSFVVGWIPGVSVGILVNIVAIPRHLALLCVTPLRIFAFFCFTGGHTITISLCLCPSSFAVSIRASLTGWLIVHRQTKLVAPSGFIRLAATISSLFLLYTKTGVCSTIHVININFSLV